MTSGSPPDIPRLDVAVGSMPVPGLLRPSIEAALAGRALGAGPESIVAQAVAAAAQSKAVGTGGIS
ncbi:hypothetical protein ACWD6R_32650 [Streptomyces sp. NPDC005151]